MNKDDLYDEIEAHVQTVLRMVKKTYGEDTAKIVDNLLDEFISRAVEEAVAHGIHPGQVITAFVDVMLSIEQSSEAMMEARGKHTGLGNN